MATFKCDWCEEEYDKSLRFDVTATFTNEEGEIGEFVCPDCLANLLLNDPESIIVMNIDRSCEVDLTLKGGK